MRIVRNVAVLVIGVLGAFLTAPAGLPAQATVQAPVQVSGPAGGAGARTVTLITGDRVRVSTVAGQTAVDVEPGRGREKIPFITHSAGTDVRVVPADAVGLLDHGKLDARLFDVSALLSFGYDDSRATLPLIVSQTPGSATHGTLSGARITRVLSATGATAIEESRPDAVSFWNALTARGADGARTLSAGFDKVWLDGLRHPSLDVSVPLTGAPQAWQSGWTGAGVKVGLIDTGVDTSHPDLAGQVAAAENFTADADATDWVGHGTHVASTIAGSAAASGGRYRGMAPGARLYSAKVCTVAGCPESAILAGLSWAAQQGVRVANVSLGGPDTPQTDPIEEAVQQLTAKFGILFVVAAGNSGEAGESTINSPGSVPEALTVGAVSKTGELAEFSSQGPRSTDAAVKPDVTAPGVAIVAARSKDSDLPPYSGDELYTRLSGTSMATPHVTGAVAILAQQHPDWTPERLKATLMAAANPSPEIGVYGQGAGSIDVARAITQTVTAAPASVGFERGKANQSQTITYVNSGTTAVTLAVRLNVPEAAETFALSTSSMTVAALGSAQVTVSVNDPAAASDTYVGGEVTAEGDGVRVQTPVALDIERHLLTLTKVGPQGAPPTAGQDWVTIVTDLDRQTSTVLADTAATTQVRLRESRYLVQTYLQTGLDGRSITSLVSPSVELDRDRELTMDARLAKPIAVSIPEAGAVPAFQEAGWTIRTRAPEIWGSNDPFGVLMNVSFARLRTAQIGAGKTPGFTSYVHGIWAAPQDDLTHNSPYVYRVYLYEPGRMMTGLRRALRQSDFATVRSQVSADVEGVPVSRMSVARAPGNSPVTRSEDGRSSQLSFTYDLPATITEYYNQDKQAQWQTTSAQQGYTYYEGDWTSHRPGRTYQTKWANAVAGPVFPEPDFAQQFATRYFGDTLAGPGPLHGDGSGHQGFRFTRTGSAKVTVYRDGVQVGTASQAPQSFEVPAEEGRYRLVASFRSDPAFLLSTTVDAEWTFTSAHVGDDELVKLPLTAVRFSPELDITNKAPADRLFVLPVTLERQVGAVAGRTTQLTVEASFDDGRTWRELTVRRTGEHAQALVPHPKGTGFVSLRANATDTAGNTVKQTIVRAYRY